MTNLEEYSQEQAGLSPDQVRSMDNYMLGILSVYVPQDVWLKCTAAASECLISASGVQRVPDPPAKAGDAVSASAPGPVELNGKPIPRNQQLATLAGPRCPRHKGFLWKECKRPECIQDYAEWLERKS